VLFVSPLQVLSHFGPSHLTAEYWSLQTHALAQTTRCVSRHAALRYIWTIVTHRQRHPLIAVIIGTRWMLIQDVHLFSLAVIDWSVDLAQGYRSPAIMDYVHDATHVDGHPDPWSLGTSIASCADHHCYADMQLWEMDHAGFLCLACVLSVQQTQTPWYHFIHALSCFPTKSSSFMPKSLQRRDCSNADCLFFSRLVSDNLVTAGLLHARQLLDGLSNDVQTLPQLSLGDDQRRRKADDVAVGGLGKQTLALQQETQVPSRPA